MNILVSACMMGVHCRYDGSAFMLEELVKYKDKIHVIPVCPEIFGGLSTPREPAEIRDGRVYTKSGVDVTKEYKAGAEEILRLAKFYDCKYAILKERSPSCGHNKIYDGTFTGTLIEGSGILGELLTHNGICVIGETKAAEPSFWEEILTT